MKIKNSIEINTSRYGGTDAYELIEVVRRIPKDATNIKHSVKHTPGDRPWESDTFSIVIEWEVE